MKIVTLDRYENPLKLLRIHANDAYAALTEDERDALLGCGEYDSINYYVLNDAAVLTVDTITGDVLCVDEITDFAKQSVNWAREQIMRG